MINSGQAFGQTAPQERRIDAIIQRLDKTSNDAEELQSRLTCMRNRVIGEVPPDKETQKTPTHTGDGHLHQLEVMELRINQSLEKLRNVLNELENVL